jgi:hypothetical protein
MNKQLPASHQEPIKVEVRVKNPEEFTKLITFCNEQGIFYVPVAAAAFAPTNSDNAARTPVKVFADFCGHAWLNPKGEMTPRNVYDFLQKFIVTHKLKRPDGTISAPKVLQDALRIQKPFLSELDVAVLSKSVFSDTPPSL